MTKDTESTVEIDNSKNSCCQFTASAYFKNCKINVNVNKWTNVGMFSLENVLLLLIREGFNKGCFFMLVSLFDYTNTCY